MFGKKMGKAIAQAVKKPAPKMAQKAPAPVQKGGVKGVAGPAIADGPNRAYIPAPGGKGLAGLPVAAAKGMATPTQSRAVGALQSGAPKANFFEPSPGMLRKAAGNAIAAKPLGAMKKGGKVQSKMGAVKTSAKPDGIAKKGKTKGRMV